MSNKGLRNNAFKKSIWDMSNILMEYSHELQNIYDKINDNSIPDEELAALIIKKEKHYSDKGIVIKINV